MAKENIAFLVNLRKNIVEGSKMEGRYYPEAESKEALTTKGFASERDDVSRSACEVGWSGHVPPHRNLYSGWCCQHRGGTSCGCEQSGAGCELRVSPRERPGRGDHFEEVQGSVLVAVRLPGGDRQEEDQRQGQVVHAPHAALCLGNYAE